MENADKGGRGRSDGSDVMQNKIRAQAGAATAGERPNLGE